MNKMFVGQGGVGGRKGRESQLWVQLISIQRMLVEIYSEPAILVKYKDELKT